MVFDEELEKRSEHMSARQQSSMTKWDLIKAIVSWLMILGVGVLIFFLGDALGNLAFDHFDQ